MAKACGEKNIDLLPLSELEKETGYIRGGCSPVGMKKLYRTFFDKEVEKFEKIMVSAITNSKHNRKIYYYDLSKMPTREVNFAKRQFASNGTPCVVRIKEGILAEEVNIRNIDRLRKFLKKNV